MAWLLALMKAMSPGLRPMISRKRRARPMRPVGLKAGPQVDLSLRLVGRALRNFDRQLKLASEFRSIVAERSALATRPPRRPARLQFPAW